MMMTPLQQHTSLLSPATTSSKEHLFKLLSLRLPQLGGSSKNSLGELLIALSKHINSYPHRTKGLDAAIGNLEIVISIGSQFYPEIARIRAARYLLTRFFYEIDAEYPGTIQIPFFADIYSEYPSAEEISSVLLSATTRTLSAVIGGCDSIVIIPTTNVADFSLEPEGRTTYYQYSAASQT